MRIIYLTSVQKLVRRIFWRRNPRNLYLHICMYFLKTAAPLKVLISRTWAPGLHSPLAPAAPCGPGKSELLCGPFLFLCLWSSLKSGYRKASEDSLSLSWEPSYSCADFWSLSALRPSEPLAPWTLLWVGGSERWVISVGCYLRKSVCVKYLIIWNI